MSLCYTISLTPMLPGLVIGAGARDEKQALAFGPMLLIPLALFGGLFLNAASTPKYFIWLAYLSPFKYGFHGTMLNEMRGTGFYCKDGATLREGGIFFFSSYASHIRLQISLLRTALFVRSLPVKRFLLNTTSSLLCGRTQAFSQL